MRALLLISLVGLGCGNVKSHLEDDAGSGGGGASATGGGTGGGASSGGGASTGGGSASGGGSSDGGLCATPLYTCPSGCCKAVAVAAGDQHSCLVTSDGTVKCWGAFYANGSTSETHRAHEVSGVTGSSAIVAGWTHTCVRLNTGGAKCWGINANGSLGNNSSVPSATPVDVMNLSSVDALASGGNFVCALANGGVQCWGAGTTGQLGDNGAADRHVPGPVSGVGSQFVSVAAGASHACAANDGGAVKCWGANIAFQLGTGAQTPQENLPVDVDAGIGFTRLSAGFNDTFALSGSDWYCWGSNSAGQCGNNGPSVTRPVTPVSLGAAGNGVIGAGPLATHQCAGIDGGGLKCWGNNDDGQLGDNSVQGRPVPEDVMNLTEPVVSIAVGSHHTCVALGTGAVRCWGLNQNGQVGDNSTQDRWVPVEVLDQ